jgi:hypothetical protein
MGDGRQAMKRKGAAGGNVLTAEDVRVEEKRLAGGREGAPSRKSVGSSGRRKNRNKRMRSGRNGKKQSSRKRRKRKVRKS